MFEAVKAFEYLASATRSKIASSSSVGLIILLAILIIWVSQIYPNLNHIEKFVKFNKYLLVKEAAIREDLRDASFNRVQKGRKRIQLTELTDTASANLEKLKIDFEIPGFPKLSQVGLQSAIVLWLGMFLLIFRYFFTSRKLFYLYNINAIVVYKKHIEGQHKPFIDFDIDFPFWVMPIPSKVGLAKDIQLESYKQLYDIKGQLYKTIIALLTLICATFFFLYNVAISLKLYYSQMYYLSTKANPHLKLIVILSVYIFLTFSIAFLWLRVLFKWLDRDSILRP
jgi:hypothetical protein